MAAEERDEPLVGRVLAEPQWQNHHHFPVPKYSSNYGSSGAGKWKWPPVDHQRIEDLTPELWGEGEMQKDKEGVEREVFKCDICLKFREKTRFHPLRGCEHKPYCSKCVGRNAREELHGKGQIKMKCPFLACEVKYEPDDIQRTCCRRDYDRFCSLSTNKMLETIEDFRHCTNKRNGCGSGQLHDAGEDGKYNIVTCHSCGWSTCYIHKEQMHFGLTCEEYDVWKDASRTLARLGSGGDEEELTKALLHQKSRQFFLFFFFFFFILNTFVENLFLCFLVPPDVQIAEFSSRKLELLTLMMKMKHAII